MRFSRNAKKETISGISRNGYTTPVFSYSPNIASFKNLSYEPKFLSARLIYHLQSPMSMIIYDSAGKFSRCCLKYPGKRKVHKKNRPHCTHRRASHFMASASALKASASEAFLVPLRDTMGSATVMSFIASKYSFIFLPATGAHEPFSMMPTFLF